MIQDELLMWLQVFTPEDKVNPLHVRTLIALNPLHMSFLVKLRALNIKSEIKGRKKQLEDKEKAELLEEEAIVRDLLKKQ